MDNGLCRIKNDPVVAAVVEQRQVQLGELAKPLAGAEFVMVQRLGMQIVARFVDRRHRFDENAGIVDAARVGRMKLRLLDAEHQPGLRRKFVGKNVVIEIPEPGRRLEVNVLVEIPALAERRVRLNNLKCLARKNG